MGDSAFATAYNAELPQTHRVEYRDDLVPHLPASIGAWLKILEGYRLVHELFPSEAPHLQINSEIAKGFEDIIERLKALLDLGLDYTSAGALQFLDWNSPPKVLPGLLRFNLEKGPQPSREGGRVQIYRDHRGPPQRRRLSDFHVLFWPFGSHGLIGAGSTAIAIYETRTGRVPGFFSL